MLNHLHQKNLWNDSIISCVEVNVRQKLQLFLSHKVSFTFLNNKTMNDESDDLKTSRNCFYVTRWSWIHYSIESFALKDIQSATRKIFDPNCHLLNMDTIINIYCGSHIWWWQQACGKNIFLWNGFNTLGQAMAAKEKENKMKIRFKNTNNGNPKDNQQDTQ